MMSFAVESPRLSRLFPTSGRRGRWGGKEPGGKHRHESQRTRNGRRNQTGKWLLHSTCQVVLKYVANAMVETDRNESGNPSLLGQLRGCPSMVEPPLLLNPPTFPLFHLPLISSLPHPFLYPNLSSWSKLVGAFCIVIVHPANRFKLFSAPLVALAR
jgi:hypothetical protein